MFVNSIRAPRKNLFEWSIILNPLPNEISKREATNTIVEVFRISHSEAEELVERTPVILLESLSEEVALQLKDYFAEINVDVSISSDPTLRRKCYRTVWPNPPSLDFLTGRVQKKPEFSKDEIRDFRVRDQRDPLTKETVVDNSLLSNPQVEPSSSQITPFLKHQQPLSDLSRAATSAPFRAQSRDAIIDQLKDKLFETQKTMELLKQENERLEQAITEANRLRAEWMSAERIEQSRDSFDSLSLEFEKKRVMMEEQIDFLKSQVDCLSKELNDTRGIQGQLQEERDRAVSQQQELVRKVSLQEQHLDEARTVLQKQREMEKENDQLRGRLERLMSEMEEFEEKSKVLDEQKRASDLRSAQLTDEVTRLHKQFEVLQKHVKDLEAAAAENRRLHDEIRRLDEELRTARERVKEFTLNREQQEAITKRLQLQNELIEKEARLKELVKKQEFIEREIVERGQVIQQVLTEQEEIERDIVRAKQAQKYLTEQIRSREKPRFKTRERLEVKSPEDAVETNSIQP